MDNTIEQIPTADEFAENYDLLYNEYQGCHIRLDELSRFAIEFAQLHVTQALKAASEKAITQDNSWGLGVDTIVDKESILNAYPLTNIK